MAISDGGFILGTAEQVVSNGLGWYAESQDGGNEDYSTENGSASRVFLTNWADRDIFIDNLLGYSSAVGANLARVLPDRHPDFNTLWAMDASSKGIGYCNKDSHGSIGFRLAKITASYQPVDYVISNAGGGELSRYCSRQYSFSSQYISLQGYMQWVTRSGNKTLNVPPGKVIGAVEKTISWHQVPGDADAQVPLEQTITALAGSVNSTTFDGHYAGAVLFLGCDPHMIKPRLTASSGMSGYYLWELQYKFLVVRDDPSDFPPVVGDTSAVAGHNYCYDVMNDRWDLVTATGLVAGPKIYAYANLNDLFDISNP